MIDDQEIREVAARLAVPERQVRRDHLLSHVISGMAGAEGVVLIGGTTLNRTHLPDVRLSEDLDLHLLDGSADALLDRTRRTVRLEFPGITVISRASRGDVVTYVLGVDDLRVQVQVVLRRHEWMQLPSQPMPVRLKYSDLQDSVELSIPTIDAFCAMKLSAYLDRKASRDLFDLMELVRIGSLGAESLALVRVLLGRSILPQEFQTCPTAEEWEVELAHQVADPGLPADALEMVRNTLAFQLDW